MNEWKKFEDELPIETDDINKHMIIVYRYFKSKHILPFQMLFIVDAIENKIEFTHWKYPDLPGDK